MTRGEGGVLEEAERQGEEWQGRSGDILGDEILTCKIIKYALAVCIVSVQ